MFIRLLYCKSTNCRKYTKKRKEKHSYLVCNKLCIEWVKNKIPIICCIFINHLPCDYSIIHIIPNIHVLTLASRSEYVDFSFISSLLNVSLDVSDLISYKSPQSMRSQRSIISWGLFFFLVPSRVIFYRMIRILNK